MMGLAYQEAVREGYLELAKGEERIKVLDADRTPEVIYKDIHDLIWDLIS